jgi:hypothetical protein
MLSRYDGKPFLRLLECYVLFLIGELGTREQSALKDLTPKLQETYNKEGEWHEIVASTMEFPDPDHMRSQILDLWNQNKLVEEKVGVYLSPENFAQMFVDENFKI